MNVLRGINGTLFIICILLAANYAKHVQHLEKMTWPKFNFDDKETTFVKPVSRQSSVSSFPSEGRFHPVIRIDKRATTAAREKNLHTSMSERIDELCN